MTSVIRPLQAVPVSGSYYLQGCDRMRVITFGFETIARF